MSSDVLLRRKWWLSYASSRNRHQHSAAPENYQREGGLLDCFGATSSGYVSRCQASCVVLVFWWWFCVLFCFFGFSFLAVTRLTKYSSAHLPCMTVPVL